MSDLTTDVETLDDEEVVVAAARRQRCILERNRGDDVVRVDVGGLDADLPRFVLRVSSTRDELAGYVATWSATVKLV